MNEKQCVPPAGGVLQPESAPGLQASA